LILFALFDQMLDRPTSSIAIQLLRCSHRLTGDRRSRKLQGHRLPFKYSVYRDKTARHVPPGLFKAWLADTA
jgi:hypothetical protein